VSCFTVGTRHSRLGGCSRNINTSWCSEQREGQLIWPYHAFPVLWHPGCMVVIPSFTHIRITFSNQRSNSCSRTVEVGIVKLKFDGECGNRVLSI
jgi:hypothetical protein